MTAQDDALLFRATPVEALSEFTEDPAYSTLRNSTARRPVNSTNW